MTARSLTARSLTATGFLLCATLLLWAGAAPDARARRQEAPPRQTREGDVDEPERWENGVTEGWWHDPEQFSPGEMAAARTRWRQIGEENGGASPHAWAGDYFVGGDTHGTYLRWSPRAGFVIVGVDKCRAMVMSLVHGGVALSNGTVEFRPEFDRRFSHGGHAVAHATGKPPEVMKYLPVGWRSERLLIGEGEVEEFGDYVAGVGDYNGLHAFSFDVAHFYYSLGPGPDAADARGDAPPVMPPGYERFIKRPVAAVITSVGRRRLAADYSIEFSSDLMRFTVPYERASLTHVTVNVGAADGVRPGTFLRVSKPNHGEYVRLTSVGRRSSVGVLARGLDERGRETFYDHDLERERNYPRIAAGWELTTALPH